MTEQTSKPSEGPHPSAPSSSSASPATSGHSDELSDHEVRRIAAIVNAIDANRAQDREPPSEPELQRADASFGFEVLQAMLGQPGSSRTNRFGRFAVVERSGDATLRIQIRQPDGSLRPARKGSVVEATPRSRLGASGTGTPTNLVADVGKDGAVKLDGLSATDALAGLVIRRRTGEPVAVAGPIGAFTAGSGS